MELLEHVRAGRFDPIYVLHSEHPILIERVVAAIRDIAVPPAARGFNYDVVEGKPRGSQIVALSQTLPMMAQRRMIYVRDISLMPADEAEPLLAYLAKPNPSTVVVAIASKIDKRIKFYGQLSKKGYLHTLEAPRQLAPWVRAEAQAHGVKLDGAAISRLVDTVGSDLSRLSLAVEQLGLYAMTAGGGQRAVTADDVDDLIADTRERNVFELTDAIGSGDRSRALVAVASLCDQRESAVGVVVMLARHVRQLSLVHALRRASVSRSEWASRLGVPPFVVDKLITQARSFQPAALAQATQRLASADRALKGDITLSTAAGDPFTGPQLKALGRELGERVILEHVVDGIVQLAG
ncbi:MAG: DNA polymerase III subunit delta [Deltaproteobacteria bacterium]|nr:DNA polymerase III subunit delta [Deltaproteobacteria bacterium]